MSVFQRRAGAFALAAAFAATLSLTSVTAAQAQDKAPDELAREGIGKIISALEMLMMTIPTYDLPEVMPNGDIIIRRRNPLNDDEAPGRSDEGDRQEVPKPI